MPSSAKPGAQHAATIKHAVPITFFFTAPPPGVPVVYIGSAAPAPHLRSLSRPLYPDPLFNIRDAQLQALQRARRLEFLRAIAGHLRAEHPDAIGNLAPEALDFLIADAVSRAEAYGIASPAALAIFTVFTFVLRRDFDQIPDFHAILTDEAIPPDDRVHALISHGSVSAWAEAHRRP